MTSHAPCVKCGYARTGTLRLVATHEHSLRCPAYKRGHCARTTRGYCHRGGTAASAARAVGARYAQKKRPCGANRRGESLNQQSGSSQSSRLGEAKHDDRHKQCPCEPCITARATVASGKRRAYCAVRLQRGTSPESRSGNRHSDRTARRHLRTTMASLEYRPKYLPNSRCAFRNG